MNKEENIISIPDEGVKPVPYDQQPGEPALWYERFQCFCSLGPSRSVLKCYQVVMQMRDTQAGRPVNDEEWQRLPL